MEYAPDTAQKRQEQCEHQHRRSSTRSLPLRAPRRERDRTDVGNTVGHRNITRSTDSCRYSKQPPVMSTATLADRTTSVVVARRESHRTTSGFHWFVTICGSWARRFHRRHRRGRCRRRRLAALSAQRLVISPAVTDRRRACRKPRPGRGVGVDARRTRRISSRLQISADPPVGCLPTTVLECAVVDHPSTPMDGYHRAQHAQQFSVLARCGSTDQAVISIA